MADEKTVIREILDKVQGYENDHQDKFEFLNRAYILASAEPHNKHRSINSSTSDPEMFTMIEAMSTAMYDMIYSDSSRAAFFDLYGEGPEDEERAKISKHVMVKQLEIIDMHEKMLPWLRNLVRDGVRVAYLPWRKDLKTVFEGTGRERRRVPVIDSFDFQEIETMRFGHSGAVRVKDNAWCYQLMPVTSAMAMRMQRLGRWLNVERALAGGPMLPTFLQRREQLSGTEHLYSKVKEMTAVSYWGELDCYNDGEMYWCEVSRNGVMLRPPRITPYDHGEFPFEDSHWIDRNDSFFSMGIAHLAWRQQIEINDRINLVNDMMIQSLFSMWLRGPGAGVKGTTLRWSPNRIIDVDAMDQLTQIKPNLEGLRQAIDFNDLRKQAMRRSTGAVETLQAIITKATATEINSAQNEAVRRAKVQIKAGIATFLRRMLSKFYALDMQFLDNSIPIRLAGENGREFTFNASNKDMVWNPDIQIKISTDNDFRPQQRSSMTEFLTAFANFAKVFPELQGTLNAPKFMETLARRYDIDPKEFIKEIMVQDQINSNPLDIARQTSLQFAREQGTPTPEELAQANFGALGEVLQ